MYRKVYHSLILRSAHTVYLCVLCGSENKQRLFPYAALTDCFLITETECVYCAVRIGSLNVIQFHIILYYIILYYIISYIISYYIILYYKTLLAF